MSTEIEIVSGDIAQVAADALITAINSGGMWFGGIDGVIQSAAGDVFHAQARGRLRNGGRLTHGEAFVATGTPNANASKFRNVVFVVDDLQGPLSEIVYAGLSVAARSGFRRVTLPMIRMGVMLGVVEKSEWVAVAEMAAGAKKVLAEGAPLDRITFVVYGNPSVQAMLREALGGAS